MVMKNGRRGLGSLNLASNTLRAAARSGAWVSVLEACGLGGGGGGADSRGAVGASANASVGSARFGSSPASRSAGRMSSSRTGAGCAGCAAATVAGPSDSLRARRCASSLAFSAFLGASGSGLLSVRRARRAFGAQVSAAGDRLGEVGRAGQVRAIGGVVAIDARVADHHRAQEDHQLGFLIAVPSL